MTEMVGAAGEEVEEEGKNFMLGMPERERDQARERGGFDDEEERRRRRRRRRGGEGGEQARTVGGGWKMSQQRATHSFINN